MIFFCLSFVVYSLKNTILPFKFNLLPIHLSVWPVAAAVLSVSRLRRGSAGGHIPQWTILVPSAAGVGSPGLGSGRLGSAMVWAAHTDQRLWPHSRPCSVRPLWPERPAETAASGSVSTQQMTSLEKKEEIYLSSVHRDPVFLWV